MTDHRYYLSEFRLDSRRLYVVWYSNDKDGLARLADGKIASFADESQVHAFCGANDMSLMPEPPAVYDFDLIVAWCRQPTAESIDPSSFLNAWNILEDALSVRFYAVNVDDITALGAEKIYNKLFFGSNLPAVTPAGESYEPIWSHDEIEILSRIYRLGLAGLRASIQ
jgi:hypothetical protein